MTTPPDTPEGRACETTACTDTEAINRDMLLGVFLRATAPRSKDSPNYIRHDPQRHLTPVEVVKRLIPREAVRGWMLDSYVPSASEHVPPSFEGADGQISSVRALRGILCYARNNGIPITADHLIFGAKSEAVDLAIVEKILESILSCEDHAK